jgi:hypothetical protein
MTTFFKIALAALVLFYIYKIFGKRNRAVKGQDKKRINTEGLEIKDADFSEIKDEK